MGGNPQFGGAGFKQPAPGRTQTVVTYVNVVAAVVQLLNNNPNRIAALVQNIGSKVNYVEYGPNVSATTGLLVQAQGGYVDNNRWEDFDKVSFAMFAFGDAAGSIMRVEETFSLDPLV